MSSAPTVPSVLKSPPSPSRFMGCCSHRPLGPFPVLAPKLQPVEPRAPSRAGPDVQAPGSAADCRAAVCGPAGMQGKGNWAGVQQGCRSHSKVSLSSQADVETTQRNCFQRHRGTGRAVPHLLHTLSSASSHPSLPLLLPCR